MSSVAAAADQFEAQLAAEAAALEALEQQLANAPGSLTRVEMLGSEQVGFAPVMGLGMLPQGKVVRGGVLLLHDSAQHPDWPDFTGPARHALASDGWHTLSIALAPMRPEPKPTRSLPPRLADGGLPAAPAVADAAAPAEAVPEPAAPEPPAPEPPLTEGAAAAEPVAPAEVPRLKSFSDMERVALGLAWLGQQNVDDQVVLGVGLGADTALAAYTSLNLGSRDVALVLINATLGFTEMNELLKQNPGLSEAVILDIYDPNSIYASALAKGRKTLMQRQEAKGYQQRAVAGVERDLRQHHEVVLRNVRGWLRRFAQSPAAPR